MSTEIMALYFFFPTLSERIKSCVVPRSPRSHCNFSDMFPPSLCQCNCTSLSDASQTYLMHWQIPPFSVLIMAIPWKRTRKRRRQARKTSRRAGLLPRWVVPHRLTGEIYLISYKKPAQGHDISLGRKLRVSQRLLENNWQDAVLLLQLRKLKAAAADLLHVLFSSRVATAPQKRVDSSDL